MSEKIAIRDAYGEALRELGGINEKVVALEADVGGSTKSILFGKAYPERYYNVGISELNMVNMSAGMALEGMIPYVNTFAVFMASRALDPVQSLIAYDHLNVRLCGTYCGLSDSYDGASHQAITDIAAMRAIPGMTVISVADAVETKKAVMALAEYEGPAYLRLSRAAEPVTYKEDFQFEIGKGVVHTEGKDLTIISAGTVLYNVLEAAKILETQGISATVVDMHTIAPIDRGLIAECAEKTGAILTVEEHSIRGGLGSAVTEVTAETCPVPVEILGMEDFAESGPLDLLTHKYGFGAEHIAERAKQLLRRKEK
ncbi:transketolase family protein [Candidatus Ventrimonas sp.]|uniref:transketolase family protein n=1 Tax=Candidatus Ventrimonas sp. TaxID=3048889 RepID=UPI003AB42DA4